MQVVQSHPSYIGHLTCDRAIALMHLSLFDLILDVLLLNAPLRRNPPPERSLVFAANTKIDAGTAGGMLLVTLLPAQATCKAT